MRSIVSFNDDWLFAPSDLPLSARDDQFQTVILPHTNIVLPYHNFDNLDYQFISTYRKRFTLPEPLNGRRLYVDFDGAMTSAQVMINGHTLGEHDGGYTPFSYDLTEYLRDGENVLQVRLDSTERPDVPPNGGVVDYLTFGGIYREAWLRYVPQVHITDVFVRPEDVLGSPKLNIDVHLKNQSGIDQEVDLLLHITVWQGALGAYALLPERRVVVPANSEMVITERFESLDPLPVRLWSFDEARNEFALYTLTTLLKLPNDQSNLRKTTFGLREVVFKDDGFYLNGEHVKLIGLDRHQTFPYIGGAAPKRLQRRDADILKYELGLNIVRTSHYPQSPHFLQRCDEIGLLVLEEIPGWQFIGDSDWKALSLQNVEAMITRDRNHPSIVLWGVRINESRDDEAFYKATNKLAHDLDPTRQTGGIRNFISSQFLEDVFTFNDFSNTIVEPRVTPHLVTEFLGHMFPTKTFDGEERQVEHAIRHAKIQDKSFGMRNVTGAIGWCAFDYNTHREFGSGDRICYHGVMDMFRLPKFAAGFYQSQGVKEAMVVVASLWTAGDRSTGGNDPLYVFSNCEEIEVYTGGELFGRFQPDREHFPNLPHPPFLVPGMTLGAMHGKYYEDLHVVGLIDGKPAAEQWLGTQGVPEQLYLAADDTELVADGADMTRLVFKLTDKYGNRMPYAIASIRLEIEGPGELIGDNPFPMAGGQAALFVKATKTAGAITVRATTERLAPAEVTIITK